MAPSATSPSAPDPFADLSDLDDYDAGVDDPFSENYRTPAQKAAEKESTSKSKSAADLGVDKALEITRKPRAPRVKLDEDRCVCQYKA